MPGLYACTSAIRPPLAVAVFLAAIGLYVWNHRDVPGGTPFLTMSVLSVLILAVIAFEKTAVAP